MSAKSNPFVERCANYTIARASNAALATLANRVTARNVVNPGLRVKLPSPANPAKRPTALNPKLKLASHIQLIDR